MKFFLGGVVGLSLGLVAHAATPAFDFQQLAARAQTLAAQPYGAKAVTVPTWLSGLSYDQHRAIKFNHQHTVWLAEELPFQLQFYHPGWLFKESVQIHTLTGPRDALIGFSPKFFDYGAQQFSEGGLEEVGFAGFRVLYNLNQHDYLDELVSFLGASYFRALGQGLEYGLSARGLAVNTATAGPEEFPRFEEFWIERPDADAKSLTIFALLNSPSVTGAYRFVITPGKITVMTVTTVLYLRDRSVVLGVAPLTSMFLHGENTGWSRDDFRPEVHDSDGLLMHNGAGEWIWRPLTNPAGTRTVTFTDHNPRGFGLLQRDRDYNHYDDVEAHYHERPNAWVEPIGDWGPGTVRLVELHTPDETNDNIVAFWVPDQLPAVGQPLTLEYRLHWMGDAMGQAGRGWVAATRTGAVLHLPDRRRVVVDFAGLPPGPAPEAVVTIGEGAEVVSQPYVRFIGPTGLWRAAFEVKADGSGRPVELRCFLRNNENVLSETWSQIWNP